MLILHNPNAVFVLEHVVIRARRNASVAAEGRRRTRVRYICRRPQATLTTFAQEACERESG